MQSEENIVTLKISEYIRLMNEYPKKGDNRMFEEITGLRYVGNKEDSLDSGLLSFEITNEKIYFLFKITTGI